MSKPLNFNNVKKRYLTVTLADDNNTTLMIGTPSKAIMDELYALQNSLEDTDEDEVTTEATDELFRVCARIMSHNKGGIMITKEYLEGIFDFEDITIFIDAYMEFISEVSTSKN